MIIDQNTIAFFLAIILSVITVLILFFIFIVKSKMPEILRFKDEKFYLDFCTNPPSRKPFPDLKDDPSVSLSVIIPAYNEENRLPSMLDECLEFLENRSAQKPDFTYELIIVDDGSADQTTNLALEYAKKYGSEKIKVLTLTKNRGKGGAVRLGMLSARGKILLFADADGATKFKDVEKLEAEMAMCDSADNLIVIGSRAHLENEAIASRSVFRTFLMYGFHFLVWLFAVRTVRDTQCGFKMFSRASARSLFYDLHVERWAFDVELLYIAEKKNMLIKEVAVNWTEIEGSKLVPFWSWLQMGMDLLLIWSKYQLRIWKISDSKKES